MFCLVYLPCLQQWHVWTAEGGPRMSAIVSSGTAWPPSRNWRRCRVNSSASGSAHAAASQRNPAARKGASFLRRAAS